jgi:hypothetical protein
MAVCFILSLDLEPASYYVGFVNIHPKMWVLRSDRTYFKGAHFCYDVFTLFLGVFMLVSLNAKLAYSLRCTLLCTEEHMLDCEHLYNLLQLAHFAGS